MNKKLLLCGMAMLGMLQVSQAKVTLLNHFDKAETVDGKKVIVSEIPENSHCEVFGNINFTDSDFGKGVICTASEDELVFNANQVINPEQGAVELWLQVNNDLDTQKKNIPVFKVILDKQNAMGAYYNVKTHKIVFWIKDTDTPAPAGRRYHGTIYPLILPSRELSWEAGESHRIAFVWSANKQRIYIDGQNNIGAYFSTFTATPTESSQLILTGDDDGSLTFDAIKVSDTFLTIEQLNKTPFK